MVDGRLAVLLVATFASGGSLKIWFEKEKRGRLGLGGTFKGSTFELDLLTFLSDEIIYLVLSRF